MMRLTRTNYRKLEEYGASDKSSSVGEALEALERLSLDVLVTLMPGTPAELISKVRTLSVRGDRFRLWR